MQGTVVAAGVVTQQATPFGSVVATISSDAAIAALGARSNLFVTKRAIITEFSFPGAVASAVAASRICTLDRSCVTVAIFVVGARESAERGAFEPSSAELTV